MNARIFAGDRCRDGVPAGDRGLAYGDGLFETMRFERGEAPWWDRHWARLLVGADRLRIPLPDEAHVRSEAGELMAGESGVLKLIVTRGEGSRGYAPDATAVPTWVLSRHALPPPFPREGVSLRWCETRLAIQPALAGLKHCNRLEQVLARSEWNAQDAGAADEGLVRSMDGDVVCATAANLFVFREGAWSTPPVDRCGVAGICRGWLMETMAGVGMRVAEARLSPHDVETADAVFLSNAVRGILPVARLGGRTWAPHDAIETLRERLGRIFPALNRQG